MKLKLELEIWKNNKNNLVTISGCGNTIHKMKKKSFKSCTMKKAIPSEW